RRDAGRLPRRGGRGSGCRQARRRELGGAGLAAGDEPASPALSYEQNREQGERGCWSCSAGSSGQETCTHFTPERPPDGTVKVPWAASGRRSDGTVIAIAGTEYYTINDQGLITSLVNEPYGLPLAPGADEAASLCRQRTRSPVVQDWGLGAHSEDAHRIAGHRAARLASC